MLNSNILDRDHDDDGPVTRSSGPSMHMPTFLLTMRRIIDKHPLIAKQFESEIASDISTRTKRSQKPRVGGLAGPRTHLIAPRSIKSSHSSQASLNNSMNNPRSSTSIARKSAISSPATSLHNQRRRKSGMVNVGDSEEDVLDTSRRVAFSSGEQLFAAEYSMDDDGPAAATQLPPLRGARRPSMMPDPRFSIIPEQEPAGPDAPDPARPAGTSGSGGAGTQSSSGSRSRKQSARAQAADMRDNHVDLTNGRRMSSVNTGPLIDAVRKTMDMERNNNDIEIIMIKHALFDDYDAQIGKIHDTTRREVARLEEERRTVKALWRLKTATFKRMVKSEGDVARVLKGQERMVGLAARLTSKACVDEGTQCAMSGASFADFKEAPGVNGKVCMNIPCNSHPRKG
jgi:hypothetical protein